MPSSRSKTHDALPSSNKLCLLACACARKPQTTPALVLQAFQGLQNGNPLAGRDGVALGTSLMHTQDIQEGRSTLMAVLQNDASAVEVSLLLIGTG